MSLDLISRTASVDKTVSLGKEVRIWHYTQIRETVIIGDNVIIGGSVYIGPGVRIGKNSKIQNKAMIYQPANIGEGVFIGPGVIFTNDLNPRAVNPDGLQKSSSDWEQVGVSVLEGASIGAGAVCIAPIQIGKWALIGAGSVVTKNVPDYGLVVGNPARQIGWVGKSGQKLQKIDELTFQCVATNTKYKLEGKLLLEIVNK